MRASKMVAQNPRVRLALGAVRSSVLQAWLGGWAGATITCMDVDQVRRPSDSSCCYWFCCFFFSLSPKLIFKWYLIKECFFVYMFLLFFFKYTRLERWFGG